MSDFITNAKLRIEAERLCDENEKLQAENAKLRELVRNLLTCIKHEECDESCPNYEPMYTDYGYEKNGSTVVESEYLGCCTVGLENCNNMLFDTDEYLGDRGGRMSNDRTITLADVEGVYRKLQDAPCGDILLEVGGYRFSSDMGYAFDGIDIYHKFLLQLFGEDFVPACEETRLSEKKSGIEVD